MGRANWRRLVCPSRIRGERVVVPPHATQSQAYIKAAGTLYKVSLILDTNPASIAAVDRAYQQKYTADPSLPLLLTD